MAEDGKKDIHRQLRDAQEQREKLMEALKESESIIASIEARLNEVTQSQDARLRADDRVDNKLLDDIQRKKIKPFIDSGEHGKLEVTKPGSNSDKGDNGKKKPDNSKELCRAKAGTKSPSTKTATRKNACAKIRSTQVN
jgi:hypothetical protein